MKAAFHTLGCKVNQYETEAISEAFEKKGYTIVDERDFADVYVVNTCTVTSTADRKSRQYIRRMKKNVLGTPCICSPHSMTNKKEFFTKNKINRNVKLYLRFAINCKKIFLRVKYSLKIAECPVVISVVRG